MADAVRNRFTVSSDYLALTDSTLFDKTKAYLLSLHDIFNYVNFPHTSEEDWPVKPV